MFPCHVNKTYSGIIAAVAGFERALDRVTRSSSLYFWMLYMLTSEWQFECVYKIKGEGGVYVMHI